MNNNEDITDNAELIRVPGIYHPGYKDGTTPKVLEFEIDNWDLPSSYYGRSYKNQTSADIYLYGHTHHNIYEQIEDKHFINPGHLKADSDRGQKASYVVIIINENNMEIQFKNLNGNIFEQKTINKL